MYGVWYMADSLYKVGSNITSYDYTRLTNFKFWGTGVSRRYTRKLLKKKKKTFERKSHQYHHIIILIIIIIIITVVSLHPPSS
jgi:hypothetical protein